MMICETLAIDSLGKPDDRAAETQGRISPGQEGRPSRPSHWNSCRGLSRFRSIRGGGPTPAAGASCRLPDACGLRRFRALRQCDGASELRVAAERIGELHLPRALAHRTSFPSGVQRLIEESRKAQAGEAQLPLREKGFGSAHGLAETESPRNR